MGRTEKFPVEIRNLAYELHVKRPSYADIVHELDLYCRKHLKRPGPSLRILHTWRKTDTWAAQDELLKTQLAEQRRSELVEEKQGILERLRTIADTTFRQYMEQVDEGVRIPPSQAVYALIQLEAFRHKLFAEGARGPDIAKILKGILQPLINIFEQKVLGRPLSDNEIEKVLAALQKEIGNRGGSKS